MIKDIKSLVEKYMVEYTGMPAETELPHSSNKSPIFSFFDRAEARIRSKYKMFNKPFNHDTSILQEFYDQNKETLDKIVDISKKSLRDPDMERRYEKVVSVLKPEDTFERIVITGLAHGKIYHTWRDIFRGNDSIFEDIYKTGHDDVDIINKLLEVMLLLYGEP
jgi:ribonucleotide reductase alpha subunit